MTALEAIDRLIEAVEAGDVRPYVIEEMAAPHFHHSIWALMAPAYNGDLNAAHALHDALLPKWVARLEIGGRGAGVKVWNCTVEDWEEGTEVHGHNQPSPARSWLLAILRAHRHQIAAGGGE